MSFVARDFVVANAGVYFMAYCVPQMIAANLGVTLPASKAAPIYHQSILRSDGQGAVETITAGPRNGRQWLRQIGLTPIEGQMAWLMHTDPLAIRPCFDTSAWRFPAIEQVYFATNWRSGDFDLAKRIFCEHQKQIERVGYNLGGRNSNTLTAALCDRVSSDPEIVKDRVLDNPRRVLARYYRPGSDIDLFYTKARDVPKVAGNWILLSVLGASAGFSSFFRAVGSRLWRKHQAS